MSRGGYRDGNSRKRTGNYYPRKRASRKAESRKKKAKQRAGRLLDAAKEQARSTLDNLKHRAREQLDKAQRVAERTYESARREARREHLTPEGARRAARETMREAQHAAEERIREAAQDKLKDVAGSLRRIGEAVTEAAKEEANRQKSRRLRQELAGVRTSRGPIRLGGRRSFRGRSRRPKPASGSGGRQGGPKRSRRPRSGSGGRRQGGGRRSPATSADPAPAARRPDARAEECVLGTMEGLAAGELPGGGKLRSHPYQADDDTSPGQRWTLAAFLLRSLCRGERAGVAHVAPGGLDPAVGAGDVGDAGLVRGKRDRGCRSRAVRHPGQAEFEIDG